MIDNKQPRTKEEILAYVNRNRYQSEGNTDTGENSRGTISSRINEFKRARLEGESTSRPVAGENDNARSIPASVTQFSPGNEISNIRSTGNNTGSYQYDRDQGTTKQTRYFSPVSTRIKNALTPFQDILKTHKKEAAKKPKSSGRVISDSEGIRLYPQLVEGILWTSENLDNFIVATTKGHDKSIEIWGNITRAEAQVLADVLIKYAKQSGRVAHAVRNFVTLYDQLKVVAIVAPRMYLTLLMYLEKGISIR